MAEDMNALVAFQNEAALTIQAVANLERNIKELKTQEEEMRESLQAAMEKFGIKSFSNDVVSFTYKDAYERKGVDSDKLRAEFPEAYRTCEKITKVKASVTIKVK